MSYLAAQQRYTSDATETVSPARLVTMLYDRLLTDLTVAEHAMDRGDIGVTGERIGHAQEILLELYATLDTTVWPEGQALADLYTWMIGQLMQARLRNDRRLVADCRELVEPLHDAWHQAQAQLAAGATSTSGSFDGAA